jgi:hypothetical protein
MSTHIVELQERLLAGERVTPKQLAEARASDELQEMQRQADEQIAAREFDASRRVALEAIRQRVLNDFNAPALEALRVRLEERVNAYLLAIVAHNEGVEHVAEELRAGGFLPGNTPGEVAGLEASDGEPLRIGDAMVRRVTTPRGILESMIRDALRKFYPRGTA